EELLSTARELYELLIKPVEKAMEPEARICMVPHGVLHYLPFQALHDGKRYLIEKRDIFYSPSSSVLKLCKSKASRDRLNLIGKNFPETQIFVGRKATASVFFEKAPGYSLVHLATHGLYDNLNPMKSGLLLAEDRLLTVKEIFQSRLNANLVTLSACETALGKNTDGDALIGMNRAFLYAGTPTVVSTLWKIADTATVEIMVDFYSNLKNMDKASALRNAQITAMEEYPNPYYWAAFKLTGDWS
ncbi:MAG: CHAT domain-containing protein, partial [Gillisia sp.]